MASMGQVLKQNKGIGPGFDFLRIGLAVSIVAFHSFLISGNLWIRKTPFWYAEYALVPMFFALSGFLVTGSAKRLTLGNFLINRSLRIIPALSVDIVVCAFIIGPIVTTYPLRGYFSDAHFFRYLLNVTGWIHFYLPGVFEKHPSNQVNGALWTVPYEMFCYLIMSFLMVSRWIEKPSRVAAATGFLFAVGMIVQIFTAIPHGRSLHDHFIFLLDFVFVSPGSQLLEAFLMGIFVYQMRDRIPYSWPIFGLCCLISLAGVFAMSSATSGHVGTRLIFVPPLIYMTVFLGLTRIPLPRFFHSGDYSYGVYLYHDPFLQVVIGLAPMTVALKGYGAVLLFAAGLPLVFLVAWGSWHYIEKPILSLRKKFSFVAKVRGVEDAHGSGIAPAGAPGIVDLPDSAVSKSGVSTG